MLLSNFASNQLSRQPIPHKQYSPDKEIAIVAFIAPAANGVRMAEEVKALRQVRDRIILINSMGRAFV